jgi:type VI secretion system protein ImpH
VAPTSRQKDPSVANPTETATIEDVLREEPFAFNFFQAVRLLSRLSPDRQAVGGFSDPGKEVVRFSAATELGFPPSQVADLEWPEGSQPRMHVSFMGLTGPQGVLPLYYSSFIRDRLRAHDHSLYEFLDIFNHRILSLFFRAWEKHHFTVCYERKEADPISPHLMDLLGMGTPHLTSRQAIPDQALLFRTGLFAAPSRSAAGLRALLMDYFEVPVEIEQFVGRWYPIDETTQCRFSDTGSDSERLGFGTVVGGEIWDQQSVVRIKLGPLTLPQYLEFLPEGAAHQPLRALVRFFAGNELDFELQLVLKKEETPSCELGAEGPTAPRLGWLTWARTGSPERDPDESILQL